ncbi:hypothetical protein Tco_0724301 [Tanacetum coccineum]
MQTMWNSQEKKKLKHTKFYSILDSSIDLTSEEARDNFLKRSVHLLKEDALTDKQYRQEDIQELMSKLLEDEPDKLFRGYFRDTSDVPTCDNNRVNDEIDFVESLIDRDTSIVHSFKIDLILEEFAGELAHIAPILPGNWKRREVASTLLIATYFFRLPEFELFHFDPSFPRPPLEPLDVEICLHFEPDALVIDNFNELNDDQRGSEIECSQRMLKMTIPFTFVFGLVSVSYLPQGFSFNLAPGRLKIRIFDPDISLVRWHLFGMELSCGFNVYPNISESPIVDFFSICFPRTINSGSTITDFGRYGSQEKEKIKTNRRKPSSLGRTECKGKTNSSQDAFGI